MPLYAFYYTPTVFPRLSRGHSWVYASIWVVPDYAPESHYMPIVTGVLHGRNGIMSPCLSRPIMFDVFCDDPPGCGIGLLFWCCQIASGCVTCRRAPLSMPSTTLCSTVSLPAVSHRTYADPYMPWCESCMRQWCYCVFLPIFLVSAWGAYSQFFTPHAPAL